MPPPPPPPPQPPGTTTTLTLPPAPDVRVDLDAAARTCRVWVPADGSVADATLADWERITMSLSLGLGLSITATRAAPPPPPTALSVTVGSGGFFYTVVWSGPATFVGVAGGWGNIAETNHGTVNHALVGTPAGDGTDTWTVPVDGAAVSAGSPCTCTIDAGTAAAGPGGTPGGAQAPAVTNNA